jgi:hypothetical protein
MSAHNKPLEAVSAKLNGPVPKERRHSKTQSAFNYDNTSSNLAATTMRNELNKLVDTAPLNVKEVISLPTVFHCHIMLTIIFRISELKWTISFLCSNDILATKQKAMKCNSRRWKLHS